MSLSRRDLLSTGLGVAGWGVLGAAAPAKGDEPETAYKVYPIGTVEKQGGTVRLRIGPKYAPALKGLDGFSHVCVLYWFHKNDTPRKRGILQVHPRGNRKNPLTGVFACRAPVRPNLIALSVCKVLSVKGGVVHVDRIDAFHDTPILDLKPHIPSIDSPKGVRLPDWLKRK